MRGGNVVEVCFSSEVTSLGACQSICVNTSVERLVLLLLLLLVDHHSAFLSVSKDNEFSATSLFSFCFRLSFSRLFSTYIFLLFSLIRFTTDETTSKMFLVSSPSLSLSLSRLTVEVTFTYFIGVPFATLIVTFLFISI